MVFFLSTPQTFVFSQMYYFFLQSVDYKLKIQKIRYYCLPNLLEDNNIYIYILASSNILLCVYGNIFIMYDEHR